jgi:hypothetical protein
VTVEVYKSQVPGSNASFFENEMWGLGNFFSSSVNVNIIDSYTSHWWENYPWAGSGGDPPASYVPHRYKGDPFADTEQRPSGSQATIPVWNATYDMGDVNDWIIIECQVVNPDLIALGYTSLPKWQCKLQWQSAGSGFADPSDPTGVKYPLNHNSGSQIFWRFSPWGGWDLATLLPDFNPLGGAPASPLCSSGNRKVNVGHFGSGNDTRDYVTLVDGQLVRWNRRNQTAYEPMALACVMGDVLPVNPAVMPMPRAILSNGAVNFVLYAEGTQKAICWGTFTSGTTYSPTVDHIGVTFWNSALAKIEEFFTLAPTGRNFMVDYGLCFPSQYAPDLEMDMFPYTVIPNTSIGARFSLPIIRVSYGVGFHPIGSKEWISTGDNTPCCYIRWDGSSDLF